MKARAEGEVAADPLGDLSPFTRRACIFILPRVSAVCIFGTGWQRVVVFRFGKIVFRHQRQQRTVKRFLLYPRHFLDARCTVGGYFVLLFHMRFSFLWKG